jgi:hypothetical protein
MDAKASCTAVVTFDVAARVIEIIRDARNDSGRRIQRLDDFQKRVQSLKRRGFLRRQEYAAATTADFQKLFLTKR